jgi:hypothetical protein
MPEKPFQLCCEPGCMGRTRARYCERHVTDNQAARNLAERTRRKNADKIWRLYNNSAWKRFRVAFLSCNPVCQRRLDDSSQCRSAATILHHIISPRKDPRLMLTWTNIKAVCDSHHPNVEGEPPENLDKLDKIYVESRYPSWMKS